MTFLSPWAAAFAAAASLPLLLLLYFLKLRRRRLQMASTLLWRKSFTDLQVNAPFQRLRLTILFLLQLLMLLLIVLAIGDPVLETDGRGASRVILLIDRSASMNATDAGIDTGAGEPKTRSRLEAAKTAAADVAERIVSRRGGAVMIIAFATRARLVTGFESRRDVLLDALDSIAPTDEEADLAAALQLAGAFARSGEETEESPPDVVLVSDGGVAPPEDPAGYSLRSGRFRFVRVGPGPGDDATPGNVGIVSMSARRDYDDPTKVVVFARLVNAGPARVQTLVRLVIDGEDGPVRGVTIDAPGDDRSDAASPAERLPPPGEASVTFDVELPVGAVLGVRHGHADALPADDAAAAVLPPPIRPRIALVRGEDDGDAYLEDLLRQSEPASLRVISAGAFAALDPAEIDTARRFDLIVFDATPPTRLPGVPSITFGAAPAGIELTEPSAAGGRRILSWQRQHPLMRYVALDTILFRGVGGLRLPVGATPLATGPDGPVIALIPGRGAQHVVVAFDLAESNWTRHVSITVFMQNVLDFLTLARSGKSSLVTRPGEPVAVRPAPGVDTLTLRAPGAAATTIATTGEPGELVTIPALTRVGVYAIDGAAPPSDRLAVSMLSDVESDIRPRGSILVNAEPALAGDVSGTAPLGVWPWFVGAAIAVLLLEWLVYCRILHL